jgi:signal transduction histidine kinase
MPKREQERGSHQRVRTRPVRLRIALLLAVPLTSLVTLWSFAAGITLTAALQRFDFSTAYERIGLPSDVVTRAVQEERAAAVVALTSSGTADSERFREKAARTDAAVTAFRRSAFSAEVKDAIDSQIAARLRVIDRSFGELQALRAETGAGTITALRAIDGYSRITDTTIQLLTTMVSVDDIAVYQNTNALLNAYWARDFVLREDALVSALPASGRMTADDRTAFATWAGNHAQFLAVARAGLTGEPAGLLQRFTASPEYAAFRASEQAVLSGGAVPRAAEWRNAVTRVSPVWLRAAQQAGDALNRRQVEPAGRAIMIRFTLAGGVGLLAVVASVVLSLLFARGISAELRTLQDAARELAHERLPRVVARLRRGEEVDVEAEAPRPETGRTREIAVVADAFATVRRTAVATAVGEAELRANINKVFVNLSWRSQSLLHRQLSLLDEMERRASGPEELESLFRLDHLTTRMRRHAEGLVILSGEPPMRAWDHPVAAEDVVRAAIAEVEDYTRIEVTGSAAVSIIGTVVADVIHLLAELIENAAAFSPPSTEVTVRAETVANGLAVEVVDRGLGLHPLEMAALNQRLAGPGEFDLADTDRLGLFVVARLAARHGIKVSLQASAYGGTTAVVLIPHSMVTPDEAPAPPPSARPPVRFPVHDPGPAAPADGGSGPAAGHETGDPFAPDSSEATGRLPRRTRQRHLAPQLRRPAAGRHADHSPNGHGPGEQSGQDFDDPSPESSRDLMSSLQSGWMRGRQWDDEPADPDPHDPDPYHERGGP